MTLEKIIENLIATGKEGDYCDFKECWHHNNADLVRDIVSLANSPHYIGERYLIIGVDNEAKVIGIKPASHLKQADIITILRDCNFAGNLFPDISLEDIQVNGKDLSIIVIKDKPEDRPYYLEKVYTQKDKGGSKDNTIYPGTIYSRVRDSNTPKDKTASLSDTEKMWRQRFGIDATPLERMTQYLLDFDGWCQPLVNGEWNGCSTPSHLLREGGSMYYRQAPEFIIKKSPLSGYDNSGLGDEVQGGESWVRKAFDPVSRMYKLELVYHQTVLHTEAVLTYDYTTLFNNPNTYSKLKNFENALFYYYLEDDILKFNILQFLHYTNLNHTSEIINPRRGDIVPLVIFKNENELEEFCNYLDSSFDASSIKDITFYEDRAYDWGNKPHDILNIQLCLFIKEELPRWRLSGCCRYLV